LEYHPLRELAKVAPLWAVVIGVMLNLSGIPQPEIIHSGLSLLTGGVVPLMLIVLGMSIRWQSIHLRFMKLLLPTVLISLILVPLTVFGVANAIGLASELHISVVLIAAMPTMIFGIVICERYQLDSELYAAVVTLTTLMSLLTLPVWFQLLSGG
jgi:predicted permease